MKKYVFTFLIICSYNNLFSQTAAQKYISRISYVLNTKTDDNGKIETNNSTRAGTINYAYNQLKKLTSITHSNKVNLNDVRKVNITYTGNTLSLIEAKNNKVQTSLLDNLQRISTLDYSLGNFPDSFPYTYKIKYSTEGFLERVNSYRGEKLKRVHEYRYSNGNISSIKNSFNDDYQSDRTPDFYFTYYDEPAIENWNLAFSFITNINVNYEKGFLYGITSKLLGKQSKNLVKSVVVHNEGYWQMTYNIEYKRNDVGLITAIIVELNGWKSVFNLTYL